VWAEKSCAQGERDGFFYLGRCFDDEGDVEKAKQNYLVCANFGDCVAMICYGKLLHIDDPNRCKWLGKALVCGHRTTATFLSDLVKHMKCFDRGEGNNRVVFAFGRVLKGHVDVSDDQIFEVESFAFHVRLSLAAIDFYEFQLEYYRKAVDIWSMIGVRNGVVKDIRKMIGKIIWDFREEAEYVQNYVRFQLNNIADIEEI
jgi:hypothetical protein